MDITSISNLATNLTQSRAAQSFGVAILKQSIDFGKANALALINSISATSASMPSYLGQNVNTMA